MHVHLNEIRHQSNANLTEAYSPYESFDDTETVVPTTKSS